MHLHQYTKFCYRKTLRSGAEPKPAMLRLKAGLQPELVASSSPAKKQPFSLAAWNTVLSDDTVFPDSEIAATEQQLVRKRPGM